ncbi:UvrD-helicase domain-containing protein [Pseudomonas sp. GV071]|uniref:UvrD-helicase domain-containing protein n=1 Tax=Pseudomonas sp. GV071 TaxID=2135754 RepID=UPI000D3C684C|nr:UvrD-helicase domain-containing protein [Pseudomonas sp. GV071]PTQ66736.1 DNA helicase-2/ATP-dependent DNA helicase PcrA [Pseudomonas sp. GV071]
MRDAELDILVHRRGSVSAPAGCGKTELITSALLRSGDSKPALVLTHTNAGRAAIEQRLKRRGVGGNTVRVATLDSWAIRLVQSLPGRSRLSPSILKVKGNNANYVAIREAALEILAAGHVDEIVVATYSRIIVDEYQDCGSLQHQMVLSLAGLLPTVVLGDPLQVIFDFAGPVVDWQKDVVVSFPPLAWKPEPWRWKNADAPELGNWLLNSVRPALSQASGSIDLSKAPKGVEWVCIEGTPAQMSETRLTIAKRKFSGSALIIADSKNKEAQWETARRARATMVEANDMVDFMKFAAAFDPVAESSLDDAVAFFGTLLSGLSPVQLIARSRSLHGGRAKTSATKIEAIALAYLGAPSHRSAADMLDAFQKAAGVFAFRPDIVRLCSRALRAVSGTFTFQEAVVRERERFRHMPRTMNSKSVGSTLLLKGLEADVAIILEPEKMNAKNLYVAMTRGSKQLIICSKSPTLTW